MPLVWAVISCDSYFTLHTSAFSQDSYLITNHFEYHDHRLIYFFYFKGWCWGVQRAAVLISTFAKASECELPITVLTLIKGYYLGHYWAFIWLLTIVYSLFLRALLSRWSVLANSIVEAINQGVVLVISTKGHKMNNHRTGMYWTPSL